MPSTTPGSSNPFPSVLLVEGSAPTTPASGKQRLFVDIADGLLKLRDDSGTVTTVRGSDITDHGGLSGLTDDDHTQYQLRSTLTTRGDLYYRGASAVGRLGIGTSGHVLTSDGTDAAWAAPTGGSTFDGTLAEIASPATPSAGTARIYPKADGRFYSMDDAGVETGPFDVAGGASLPPAGIDWMRYPYRLGMLGMLPSNHVTNPYNVSDGTFGTLASSSVGTVPQAHYVDLGVARPVTSCRIWYGTANTRSLTGELQYSSDNSSWSTAVSWTTDATTDRFHTFGSITARYWRVYTTAVGLGGQGVSIADFRLINAGTDYAKGKTPTFNQTTANATNATDDNDATVANQSNVTMPQWCRLDLGATQALTRARAVFVSTNRARDVKLQSSTDDSTWTDVPGAASAAISQDEVVFDFASVSARYWRFYVAAAMTGSVGINWATVELWGS